MGVQRDDGSGEAAGEPLLGTLAEELEEVSRLLDDDDIPAALNRLITRACRCVPGCEQATITVHATGRPETVMASHPSVLTCHDAQFGKGSGPTVEALRHGEPRRVDDVATETRWSGFNAAAREAGYRSVLALPLPTYQHPPAVLTLYGTRPAAFRSISHDIALVFAVQGGVTLDNVQLYRDSCTLIGHLQAVLASRAVIEQAKGIIIQQEGCGPDEAFARLSRVSQNANKKLRHVAEALVAGSQRGRGEQQGSGNSQ